MIVWVGVIHISRIYFQFQFWTTAYWTDYSMLSSDVPTKMVFLNQKIKSKIISLTKQFLHVKHLHITCSYWKIHPVNLLKKCKTTDVVFCDVCNSVDKANTISPQHPPLNPPGFVRVPCPVDLLFIMSSPSLSVVRGFGPERCCSSEPCVTQGPLVILTGPQSSEAVMNHPAVGEVSGCSLCAVTQPCNPGIFSRLWLHMGKGISTKPHIHTHSLVMIMFL